MGHIIWKFTTEKTTVYLSSIQTSRGQPLASKEKKSCALKKSKQEHVRGKLCREIFHLENTEPGKSRGKRRR